MQYKTPESALQAQSQESARMAKPYGPSGSNGAVFAKAPMSSTHVDALSNASHELSGLRAQLGEGVAAVVDRARRSATATDGYVRAQPWKAIGVGAAIGVLLGLVFARRA